MHRFIVLGALLFALTPGFAHKIQVDFDHGTQLSHYRTYSWTDSSNATPQDAQFPNQLMKERVMGFVDEALAARGYKRVTTGGDLAISYQIHVQEIPQFTTVSSGAGPALGWDSAWGWGGGWGSGFAVTTVETTYQGQLAIDVVDAHKKKLVFQGISSQSISSKPEKNTKKLAKAVREIFKRYPYGP